MSRFWCKRFGLLFGLALMVNLAVWLPSAQAAIIGTKEEISIGRNVAEQLEKQYGLVNDPALQERVTRIGMRIAAISDRKDLPYTFRVLNSKEVNAMACPGGFIYIFKGLVDLMPSDDELAGIIGHEVGHVVKRHTVRQIEKNLVGSILFAVLFGDRGAFIQNMALSAIMAGYSRADEQEADAMGFIHIQRAGYNPYGLLIGMQKLSELKHDGNNWFSSHPEPEGRVATLQGYIRNAKVHPLVAQVDKGARITDSGLSLPPLYATYKGAKPLYRTEFAAGELYLLTKLPDLDGERFILDSDGTFISLYYDDRLIVVLTPQDASSNNTSLDGLASQYVEALKSWVAAGKTAKS